MNYKKKMKCKYCLSEVPEYISQDEKPECLFRRTINCEDTNILAVATILDGELVMTMMNDEGVYIYEKLARFNFCPICGSNLRKEKK